MEVEKKSPAMAPSAALISRISFANASTWFLVGGYLPSSFLFSGCQAIHTLSAGVTCSNQMTCFYVFSYLIIPKAVDCKQNNLLNLYARYLALNSTISAAYHYYPVLCWVAHSKHSHDMYLYMYAFSKSPPSRDSNPTSTHRSMFSVLQMSVINCLNSFQSILCKKVARRIIPGTEARPSASFCPRFPC